MRKRLESLLFVAPLAIALLSSASLLQAQQTPPDTQQPSTQSSPQQPPDTQAPPSSQQQAPAQTQPGQMPEQTPGQTQPPRTPDQGQPSPSAPSTSPSTSTPEASSPSSASPEGGAGASKEFVGTVVKQGDKYVFQDSATGTSYDIDHQDEVKKFEGKRVRFHGTLSADGKTIHVQ